MIDEARVNDLKQKFEALRKKRDALQARKDRIQGRKEAAEKNLKEVEDEIRSKGLDPDKLDEVLVSLIDKYNVHLEEANEAYRFVDSKLTEMEE